MTIASNLDKDARCALIENILQVILTLPDASLLAVASAAGVSKALGDGSDDPGEPYVAQSDQEAACGM